MSDPTPTLSADDIRALAAGYAPAGRCACAGLRCDGWETLSATFDETLLRRVGHVRQEPAADTSGAPEEPTVEEYHPAGTRYDSADAPIALRHFPYNRCELWQCVRCGRPFLRYTEYGGYYIDHRIREVKAALVVDVPPAPGVS